MAWPPHNRWSLSETEGATASTTDVFKQVKEVDDEINLEDPHDYVIAPLPAEFCFEEPYNRAKYKVVVPMDFRNQKFVPAEAEHPHKRFVGRKIWKSFEVDDVTKKRVSKSFEGVVLSYSTERQLFKVMYDVDKTQRRSGFLRAQPSAGDGKEMGRSA